MTMQNGDILLSWLNYDPESKIFKGTPPYMQIFQNIQVTLTVSDAFQSTSETLNISIEISAVFAIKVIAIILAPFVAFLLFWFN